MAERRDDLMAVRSRAMVSLPAGIETTSIAHRSADDAELARVRARVTAALDRPFGARPARQRTTPSVPKPKPKRAQRARTTTTLAGSTAEQQRARRHLERIA